MIKNDQQAAHISLYILCKLYIISILFQVKVWFIGMKKRYYDLNTYFRNIFGCRVQKISVDAGLSCPNRDGTISEGGCIYCNDKGSGTGAHAKGLSIRSQLELSMPHLIRRYKAKKFMAYFQSFSNTHAPVAELKRIYDEALAVHNVIGLSIGTRPDCINREILNLIQEYTQDYLIWLEYGLQSAHDSTLSLIQRGHDFDCFKRAVEMTRNRDIKICAHVILGLPGETREHMVKTAKIISGMDIQGVKLHLLYVIKGTPLESLYRQGRYHCLEISEYAELVCDFLEQLPPEMVIQRLTSDPHPDELVSPQWSLDKNTIRTLINRQFEKRNTWQGQYYENQPAI